MFLLIQHGILIQSSTTRWSYCGHQSLNSVLPDPAIVQCLQKCAPPYWHPHSLTGLQGSAYRVISYSRGCRGDSGKVADLAESAPQFCKSQSRRAGILCRQTLEQRKLPLSLPWPHDRTVAHIYLHTWVVKKLSPSQPNRNVRKGVNKKERPPYVDSHPLRPAPSSSPILGLNRVKVGY